MYSVSPMVLPRRLDMHRPSTNAVTTADSVFISAGISRLKYGSSEVACGCGDLVERIRTHEVREQGVGYKNEAEPAIRVEQ